MKKDYQKPTMNVLRIQATSLLMNSVTNVVSNVDLKNGGGGSGPAHSRDGNSFDDEDEY